MLYSLMYSATNLNLSKFNIIFLYFILSRLERLQRIVSKVQMESGLCDEQLGHLETLLQKVSPESDSFILLHTLFVRQCDCC